ncbi:MAG: hypothetical protein E6I08_08085 [Chloroflexi bacterium]|nr:MAG: hypothetical protein E6I08_08085 [Chloroflexota bacterium]
MRPEEESPASTLAGWAGAVAVLATMGTAAYLLLRLRQTDLVLHLYVVTLGVCGVVGLADRAFRRLRVDDGPSLIARIRRRPPRLHPERVRSLEELEHAVDFAVTTSFDVHYRLRPHLARIAAHRLAARRGISLEDQPRLARQALGEELWAVVDPDREPPLERNAPGMPLARLRRLVAALEQV